MELNYLPSTCIMLFSFFTLMPLFVSLLWAVVLLFASHKNRAKPMLGVFMFVSFLMFLTHFVYYNGYKSIYLYFDLLFTAGSLTIFPLYYLYIRLLTRSEKLKPKHIRLFIPAFLLFGASAFVYSIMSPELRQYYINNYIFDNQSFSNAHLLIKLQLILLYILQLIYFLQIVFSTYKIKKYIDQYNNRIYEFYSNVEDKKMEWPKLIFYSFVCISVVSIAYNFLGRSYFSQSALALSVPSVSYTILLFSFGYLGNLQNYNIVDYNIDKKAIPDDDNDIKNTVESNRVKQDVQLQNKLIDAIKQLMENEKIYQKFDLKITDIAFLLHSNRTYISKAINSHCGCTFNAFVNKYRVAEAKQLLSDSENKYFTLEFIATKVGFANIHTFLRVFKELENTTPGQFRENALNMRDRA